MTFVKKLLTLGNVRAGEGKVVAWVLIYAMLSNTAYVLASTTAYALFLSEFDAQRLPFVYIGSSIFTTLLSLLYLRLSQRYSLAQLLLGQFAFILFTLIGYRIGLLATAGRWFIFSLPIWEGVVRTLLFTSFWNLVGRLFNLQQGKRLFSLFGAGQQAANLGVGLLVPLLVVWLGTPNLLWVAACAAIGALVILLRITATFTQLHTFVEGSTEASTETDPSATTATKNLLADPYIRLIFAMLVCLGFSSFFVDNIFYTQVKSQLTSQDQLASFLGIYSGIVGGLSMVIQLFIANRLFNHYGVRVTILLTPLLLLFCTLLFVSARLVAGATLVLFALAVLMNLTRQVMDAADNTSANLLYQPLPAALRTRTQTAIDGVVYPLSVGATGLLLWWLTNALQFNSVQLAWVLLPLLLIWVLTASAVGRRYLHQVQQALRNRSVQGNQTFQPDRASLEIIRQNLSNPYAGTVIYALDLLTSLDAETTTQCLPLLLQHADPLVRLEALARLERLASPAALPAIQHTLRTDSDAKVRSAALRALAILGENEQLEELYPYLTAPEPELRQSVVVGFLRSGELEGLLAASEVVVQLVNSQAAADRIFAAQILAESGITSFYRPLLKLLRDTDPAVQRAALKTAGALKHPKSWTLVIEALRSTQTRAAAQRALVAGGEPVLPYLATAFEQAGQDRQLRITLARTCGRLRGKQAATLLLAHLAFPAVEVRTQTLLALYQSGYHATDEVVTLCQAQIRDEVAQAAWTLAAWVDMAEVASAELLCNTLAVSLAQQRVRILQWLALLYDAPVIQKVTYLLTVVAGSRRQVSDEQRSYALEAIDIVAKGLSKDILPLFEGLPPVEQYKRLAESFPQPRLLPQPRLSAIIAAETCWVSSWLKAVAIYTAATLPGADDVQIDEIDDKEVSKMLLTVEKVMILKSVDIFAHTPDEILVDIAALLKEVEKPADTVIFEKGDLGDSMYIIVSGEVAAMDGERVFTRMGERQVFGEMALLDGEPRTATIRTTQAVQLLRLDQEPFYELMDDRIEIARGVIHVLLQRLRARTDDVNRLRAQVGT